MPKFRVLVFSPEFNVVRRFTFEADDEFAAVETVEFMLEEMNAKDPESSSIVTEVQ